MTIYHCWGVLRLCPAVDQTWLIFVKSPKKKLLTYIYLVTYPQNTIKPSNNDHLSLLGCTEALSCSRSNLFCFFKNPKNTLLTYSYVLANGQNIKKFVNTGHLLLLEYTEALSCSSSNLLIFLSKI